MSKPDFAALGRAAAVWLVASMTSLFLLLLVLPTDGGLLPERTGVAFIERLLVAAMPLSFGFALGVGCPGVAAWALLGLTALMPAIGLARPAALAAMIAAASAALVAGAWAARRKGLSANGRVIAALLACLAVCAVSVAAEFLGLIPRGFVIYDPMP